MNINIVGEGKFGNFLRSEFVANGHKVLNDDVKYDMHILAVPFSAYKAVVDQLVEKYGRSIHLVNVCSVQQMTNVIIRAAISEGGSATGIHPLFGPRSSTNVSERISIVTMKYGLQSKAVLKLFSEISMVRDDGLNGEAHDRIMALTQLQAVKISQQVKKIVNDAQYVPDYLLTPSFKKMREMSNQLMDMSPGTEESILANLY